MKNLKFNAKKLGVILGMSVGMSLVSGCSQKKEVKTVSGVINEIADSTCLDELMTSKKIEEVDELLKYIDLSKQLEDLNLGTLDINLEGFNLLSPFRIKELIAAYTNKKSSDYFSAEEMSQLKTELLIEKYLVNGYIYNYGYYLGEDFLISVLKSEVLDAYGVGENWIGEVRILPENESLINSTPSGFGDYVRLTDDIKTSDTNIIDSMRLLYKLQTKGDYVHDEYESTEYNPGRNALIKSAIDQGIKTAQREYSIDDGIMKKLRK